MRIGKIVSHLLENDQELVAIMYGNASLLNVDDTELKAIIEVLTTDSELLFLREDE